ncbi:hypothetical protein SUGI_0179690 [Cryptomeria japonica]|uniref:uncharacterized protein LOC131038065 n=1 Tax=Cryptomeria japonica TaxID=3369 RepID=UPI002408C10B|nr:uncharacterized protein LOC131038065 [Cryptomeria japonica]GLJ11898.1 hypothetical protein SUGI_0179690 [Cryptomeria japonica]
MEKIDVSLQKNDKEWNVEKDRPFNGPTEVKFVQDEASPETRPQIVAMTQSIKALHLLLSLQSMTSGCGIKSKPKIPPPGEIEKYSEKFERLIGAIRVLEDDLQAERCKLKRLNTCSLYADIGRMCLFTIGLWALVTSIS